MKALELKIPPPLLALLFAAGMWMLSTLPPLLQVPTFIRMFVAAAIAFVGVAISFAGVFSFRCAKTTVNPMKPRNASSLVTTGVYQVTRNPMYLGLLLVLIGWAVYLSSVWALVGVVAFVYYIERFQIKPEEQALDALFSAEYSAYKTQVRRWL